MPVSEPLVGMWDLYSGPTVSEIVLKPDGTYSHAFWGGAQGHWGTWSLDEINGHSVLVMHVQGAQPTMMNGPGGPQPIQWPAVEQWAILSVLPNQVNFYGALMVRRFPAALFHPPTVATQPSVNAPAATPLPNPAPPPILNWNVLGAYQQMPPVPTPPAVHSPQILNQWQNVQPVFHSQVLNSPPASPSLPPDQQNWVNQQQTAIEIFKAQHQVNTEWYEAHAQAILDQENATHRIAKKYESYARS